MNDSGNGGWRRLQPANCGKMRAIAGKMLRTLCGHNDGNGLIQLYEVAGTRYLQLNRWKERARSESRYPECTVTALCQHDAVTPLSNDKQMPASPPTPTPTPTPTPEREGTPELFSPKKK
jgi:hypothetical protein